MLELSGAGFHYRGRDWVFRNVGFQVPTGSITAVLGPNGRGKTTLVRCAAGMLTPQEGVITRDGSVGFVPQAHGGAFAYRSLDMVLMGRARQVRLFGTPGRADQQAAHDAMERVGVRHLGERPFPTLSGGEQQLVLVARAIASDCPILALDEPSTGLDLHNQAQVLSLLRSLAAGGMTILLTTHHPDHAMYLADFVVLMMGGSDVRTGDAAIMLTDQALSDVYGVEVRTVSYHHDGIEQRAVITRYEQGHAAVPGGQQ